MSDTPKLADECKRLLDNGWVIQLYRNELGSYTAAAMPPKIVKALEAADDEEDVELDDWSEAALEDPEKFKDRFITDDFEPSQALYRLTEKVFGNIA